MTLQKEEIQKKIVGITLDLMDSGGLEAVRAREIAKQAGVSVGTIYNFFGNLDGLIEHVNLITFDELRRFGDEVQSGNNGAASSEILRSVPDGSPEMKSLVTGFLELAMAYLLFTERFGNRWSAVLQFNTGRLPSEISDEYKRGQNVLFHLVEQVIVSARPELEDVVVRRAARTLWSAVHGIVTLNYLGMINTKNREETWQQIVLLVVNFTNGFLLDETS